MTMWFPAETVPSSARKEGVTPRDNGGLLSIGCDCACHSPPRDFSHILESSHVTFANSSRGVSYKGIDPPVRMRSSIGSGARTQDLQVSSTSRRKRAKTSNNRGALHGVEESYLQEIDHLQQLAKQFDEERSEAVDRAEEMRAAYERSRQQSILKEREIQSLGDQMHRLQDKLHRAEYQLTSVQSICRRDAEFHREQQLLLFEENERNTREALVFAEASWRTVIQERCSNTMSALAHKQYSSVERHSEELGVAHHGCRSEKTWNQAYTDRPVSCPAQRCTSTSRQYSGQQEEDCWATPATGMKSTLLAELHQSKKRADETIEQLKRELEEKEEVIASLRNQLNLQEEGLQKVPRAGGSDESLMMEMQAEIDDLLLNELLLTHSCERYALETEAMEELTYALRWLLQQHAFALQEAPFITPQRTPAGSKQPVLPRTPGTSPHLVEVHSAASPGCNDVTTSVAEMRAIVGDTVLEVIKKELQGCLLPIRLSVESMRASSEELIGDLRKAVRDAGYNAPQLTPSITMGEIKSEHAALLRNIQRSLDDMNTTVAPPLCTELKQLRETVVKVGRLTAHNNKVMDDKLSDILNCQSAVSRQMILSALPCDEKLDFCRTPVAECSTTVPPAKVSLSREGANAISSVGGGLNYNAENVLSDGGNESGVSIKKTQSHESSGAYVDSTGPAFHDWDVESSDSKFMVPSMDVPIIRKTPYDIEDA
ncbi:hypothetical protein, conserved [Trypanosoma brucei gambiense DAL972]|uniref:Uncharacterized protein n=1 Tax=Trypanosoma brucei gambiense (strain MHOM/CI/86/DAL972) TaxID=679716 RepID=D0A5F6_TRYB9|nr:hypothetical protein, conserved [Trypanosoma brucei gambiense DAL972]CBH16907.1 hypothetical protein, conserved [Trypanosoma brucei gambiense DAL972]|eukprot:XP_011779171.1 hypothetical protein, conserved [Trypanosoma brucei gambiense DAL972]